MNQLIFKPTDVLFFKDGRPMEGASRGKGATFPDPHVLNSALHVALHRADQRESLGGHSHQWKNRSGKKGHVEERSEKFGSLRSAGPFPVDENGDWYFPKPLDLNDPQEGVAVVPVTDTEFAGNSNLPQGLYPLGALQPASKNEHVSWLSKSEYERYLKGMPIGQGKKDNDFFGEETTMGIGIDPMSQTTIKGAFFSRSQMRFKNGCGLGSLVETGNKHNKVEDKNLIPTLFPDKDLINIGGENRNCHVERRELNDASQSLPLGLIPEGTRLKWVLLSPAIFQFIEYNSPHKADHSGGWLPSWINPSNFEVELLDGPGKSKAKRTGQKVGQRIEAKLVAVRVENPKIITGWSNAESEGAREEGRSGARSTLLAVAAGSVFYFEGKDPTAIQKLAQALNWNENNLKPSGVLNRRSGLFGEKGFGIGVCAPWESFSVVKNKYKTKLQ